MTETIKAMIPVAWLQATWTQTAWLEPVLLMIAGAFAGLAAARTFA